MAENTTEQMLKVKPSLQVQQNSIIHLYYGATTAEKVKNKQELGIEFDQDSISEIRLTETMFGKLPKLIIKLFDNGEWTNTFALQPGTNIRMILTPRNGNEDYEMSPLIDCFFKLEGVNYFMDQHSARYCYELSCIYSGETYINQVCQWPTEDILQKAKGAVVSAAKSALGISTKNDNPYKRTSKEVLGELIDKSGLKFVYKCKNEPNDKMLWLNQTLTYAKFAKHIIDHAWISKNDCPLFYINKKGQWIYDSVSSLASQQVKYSFIFEDCYRAKKQAAIQNGKNEVIAKPYMDLAFFNVPYKFFDDGCTVQASQYNPYNKDDLDKDEQKPQKIEDEEEKSYRQVEFNGNIPRLATVSNKSTTSLKSLNTRKFTGTYFKELHEYYNVAPLHHKNIKNSFFTNFCYMSLNIDEQFDNQTDIIKTKDDSAITYLNLGDKIHIDTSDRKHRNDILSGDYIICGLTHLWAPNNNYTIVVQCVNDGLYSAGQLSMYQEEIKKKQNKKSK